MLALFHAETTEQHEDLARNLDQVTAASEVRLEKERIQAAVIASPAEKEFFRMSAKEQSAEVRSPDLGEHSTGARLPRRFDDIARKNLPVLRPWLRIA